MQAMHRLYRVRRNRGNKVMQRLVLAVLLLALLVGLVTALAKAIGRTRSVSGTEISESHPMPKISFFLLLALIIYVSASGMN